jgi:hypothetical protein
MHLFGNYVLIASQERSRMVTISGDLRLALLTRDLDNAGSNSSLQTVVNIDGTDVVRHPVIYRPPFDIKTGNAGILPVASMVGRLIQFDSTLLTNSSVRVEITGDNALGPQHMFLLGKTDPLTTEVVQWIPLAIEVDTTDIWLSTDTGEGRISMPLRLVRLGRNSTIIRRVLLLLVTYHNDNNAGTDDRIELEITAGGNVVLKQTTGYGTPQDDIEKKSHNWYFLNVPVPFTKADVLSNGGIKLSITGKDKWLPRELYVYGFDTAEGRPREIVHLFSTDKWSQGWLSKDANEGQESVTLPVS